MIHVGLGPCCHVLNSLISRASVLQGSSQRCLIRQRRCPLSGYRTYSAWTQPNRITRPATTLSPVALFVYIPVKTSSIFIPLDTRSEGQTALIRLFLGLYFNPWSAASFVLLCLLRDMEDRGKALTVFATSSTAVENQITLCNTNISFVGDLKCKLP